jgi:hypothetical protein
LRLNALDKKAATDCGRFFIWHGDPEDFQAKWRPVRVKKTRQIKNPEPRFDSIETKMALVQTAECVDQHKNWKRHTEQPQQQVTSH